MSATMHRLSIALVVGLLGCDSNNDDAFADGSLPNCGHVASSWVGGHERSGWRDEGQGYITAYEASWSDTPSESVGDGPSARILHCPSGNGVWIGWSREAKLSALDFLDMVRAQNDFGSDLISKAKAHQLRVRSTVAGRDSKIAACGCMAHYPDLQLPWTTRDN